MAAAIAPAVIAAEVFVYATGAACPPNAKQPTGPLSDQEAIAIVKPLMPAAYCSSGGVSDCEYYAEWLNQSWRVLVHPFFLDQQGARSYRSALHHWVILDARGNCIANIPGTHH